MLTTLTHFLPPSPPTTLCLHLSTQFGPVKYVRHFAHKGFSFVQYFMRASAEFAKEAMGNQVIRGTEPVLSVRWAREDPNPRVIEMLKKRKQNAVADQVK